MQASPGADKINQARVRAGIVGVDHGGAELFGQCRDDGTLGCKTMRTQDIPKPRLLMGLDFKGAHQIGRGHLPMPEQDCPQWRAFHLWRRRHGLQGDRRRMPLAERIIDAKLPEAHVHPNPCPYYPGLGSLWRKNC